MTNSEKAWEMLDKRASFILNVVAKAAEMASVPVYDLWVIIYDHEARHHVARCLGQPMDAVGKDNLFINLVIPARDGPLALRQLGMPPMPEGDGVGVIACVKGVRLRARLHSDSGAQT